MRLLALLLVAFVFAHPALAQQDVRFGLRVDGNASSLLLDFGDADVDAGIEPEAGFGIASLAQVSLTNRLGAAAELAYARRSYSHEIGFRGLGGESLGSGEWFTSFNIASVALLGRVLPFGRRPMRPYLIAGPRLDLVLSSDPGRADVPDILLEMQPEMPDVLDDPFAGQFADAGLSGVVGLGLDLTTLPAGRLHVELRYSRILTDFLVDAPVEGSFGAVDLGIGLTL